MIVRGGEGETTSATDDPVRVYDARGEGQGHGRLWWYPLPGVLQDQHHKTQPVH